MSEEQPRPVSHCGAVHATASHEATPGVHFTSQPHDGLHVTLRHEFEPEQVTSHFPLPHWRSRHEDVPVQPILQLPGPVHVTPCRHEFAVLHATSQFQPTGQTIGALQLVTAQSTLHVCVCRSQLVHWVGHTLPGPSFGTSAGGPSVVLGASIVPPGNTQYPPVQVRPPVQSACFVHSNSPLR